MKYNEYFEIKKRGEEDFVCLKEGRPEELYELIKDIHINHFYKCLPNDWIYETVCEAFEAFEDRYSKEHWEDAIYEIEPETRHDKLITWLHNSFADDYCVEYFNEIGGAITGVYDLISIGYLFAENRIYEVVKEFLEERLDHE